MATGTLIAGGEQDARSRLPAPRPTYCCAGCGLVLRVSVSVATACTLSSATSEQMSL